MYTIPAISPDAPYLRLPNLPTPLVNILVIFVHAFPQSSLHSTEGKPNLTTYIYITILTTLLDINSKCLGR